MAEPYLSKSSLEAYSAIFLGIVAYVYQVTALTCLLMTLVVAGLAIDIACRVKLPRFIGDEYQSLLAIVVCGIIGILGIMRASSISAATNVDDFKIGPFPSVSLSLVAQNDGYVETAVLKNYGDEPMLNFSAILGGGFAGKIVTQETETKKFLANMNIMQLVQIGNLDKGQTLGNVLQPNETFEIQNGNNPIKN